MPKYFVYGTPSKNTFVWKMPVVLCVMGIKEELVLVISCNMSAWEEFTNACWAGTFNSSFHREELAGQGVTQFFFCRGGS